VLPLPENADEENVRCEFRNGVLTVRLPKLEQMPTRGRRIPIAEGSERATAGAKGGEASTMEQGGQPQAGQQQAGQSQTNQPRSDQGESGQSGGSSSKKGA
jgi:hypothetical protein